MPKWAERSPVAAAMLNPALIAAILATAAEDYRKESGRGMPWELAFIVSPLVLHRATREALPSSIRTHLANWISANPALHAGFPSRARNLTAPIKEGLRFGLTHRILTLEGAVLLGQIKRPRGFSTPDELRDLLRPARLAGRWLSKADATSTVFALFGVAP